MPRKTLRLTSRFALVLVVLIPALLVMMAAGLHGLQAGQSATNGLYKKHLIATQRVTALDISLQKAQQTILRLLLADTPDDRLTLTTDLVMGQVPAIEVAFNAIASQADGDQKAQAALAPIAGGWGAFLHALADGSLAGDLSQADKIATAARLDHAFDQATTGAGGLIAIETAQAAQAHRSSIDTFHASVVTMLVAGVLGLISSVGIVLWLLRGVLPRTLAYSAFAAEVSGGDFSRRLRPRGDDELDRLGSVLDDLAERRQSEDAYDRQRLELIDSLQLAEGEQEAHVFLKRHVELAVAGCEVTILNRNNSAGRLQAVTPVPGDSPLAAGLESAKPRSCLAVRRAQSHSSASQQGLLGCSVCSGCPGHTVCAPLIVGGEVIGSVLANHAQELGEVDQRSIREAVTHAAPVMGNLRNLAIAERRASTDSLTGLPNKRAIGDTIRRMVAHSNKTKTPLAALMCDSTISNRSMTSTGMGQATTCSPQSARFCAAESGRATLPDATAARSS